MNTTYTVTARYHDYEFGAGTLERRFTTLHEAQSMSERITAHIAFAGPRGTAHPRLRTPDQEENETDEAFEERERAYQARLEQHDDESLDWFDSGHGYFTSHPEILRTTQEVVT